MNSFFVMLYNKFDKLEATITIKIIIIKKLKEYKSKKNLFNIYIVLHYINIATEYITVVNCNVFTKKIIHK